MDFGGLKRLLGLEQAPAPQQGKPARPMKPAMGRGAATADNNITNKQVAAGRLPAAQAEIYAQPRPGLTVQSQNLRTTTPFGMGGEEQQIQAAPVLPLQRSLQGGQFNPGYVPLQQSPVNWQNVGRKRNMVNPQVNDDGYYYNN